MRTSLLLALGGALAACAAMIEPPVPLADLAPQPERSVEMERIDAAMAEARRIARAASEQALAPTVAAPAITRARPIPPTPPSLPR